MGIILTWILCILFDLFVTHANSNPIGENQRQQLHVLPFIAKGSDGNGACQDSEAFQWTYEFHDCFINRKYKDGGRDLNSIVDRILDHGEACVEISSKECRPDFRGFISLLNKTISQMKDYSEMYLEEIYKGRENIKDLGCVEKVMSIKTYEECFRDIVNQPVDLSEENFQKKVKEGISCANRRNSGCSKEAKTALNRIVRIILGVEEPNEENFEEEIKTTAVPTTEKVPEETFQTTDTQATETEYEDHDQLTEGQPKAWEGDEDKPTERQPKTWEVEDETEFQPNFQDEVKPTKAPEPMRWYDYLAWPFVQAWKWVSGLFG